MGARLKTWNTCCCRYHQELKELLQGFNDMRTCGTWIHDNRLCSCIEICALITYNSHSNKHCATKFWTFNGLTTLWTSICCEKELDAMWHHSQCIASECACCGWKLFQLCPWELNRMIVSNGIAQVMKWFVTQRREKKRKCQRLSFLKCHLGTISYL